MSTLTGNHIVDAMASMRLTGNVIPQIWYKTIKRDSGKPDLLAITILAEIAYWYRPTEVRDEATGQLIGYQKKIKEDLFQRSYDDFADMLGEKKRTVTDAIVRLEKIGVIKRVFRTVKVGGVYHSNNLYLELFPKKLYELTYPNETETNKCDSYPQNTGHLSQKNVTSTTQKCGAPHEKMGEPTQKTGRRNTKNTTKNTTEIISSSPKSPYELSDYESDDDKLKSRIDFDNAMKRYPDTAAVVYDEIRKDVKHNDMYDAMLYARSFMELCENIEKHSSPIGNLSAYIRTCLSNMAKDQKLRKQKSKFNSHMQTDYDISELEKHILSN